MKMAENGVGECVVKKLAACGGAMESQPDRLQRFCSYCLHLYYSHEVLNGDLGRVDTTLDGHFHFVMLPSCNGHMQISNRYNFYFQKNDAMSKLTD